MINGLNYSLIVCWLSTPLIHYTFLKDGKISRIPKHLLLISRVLFKVRTLWPSVSLSSSGLHSSGDQRRVLTYIYFPSLWFKLTPLPSTAQHKGASKHIVQFPRKPPTDICTARLATSSSTAFQNSLGRRTVCAATPRTGSACRGTGSAHRCSSRGWNWDNAIV